MCNTHHHQDRSWCLLTYGNILFCPAKGFKAWIGNRWPAGAEKSEKVCLRTAPIGTRTQDLNTGGGHTINEGIASSEVCRSKVNGTALYIYYLYLIEE